ncbi:MAG: Inositol monophosphatase, partial [Parcubacteria group bacterium GW2011_GWC2_49_9]
FKSRLRIAHSLQYLWKAFLNTRVLGSGSLNLAFVAAGRVEGCYLALTSNLWDTTSGVLLVKEAGGIVTDLNGKPWDMKSQSLVASNRTIHARLLRNVRR